MFFDVFAVLCGLMVHLTSATCDPSDIATMIGNKAQDYTINEVVAAIRPDTFDIVVGGSTSIYDSNDDVGFLYFLDYSECEIKWLVVFMELEAIIDVTFANGGSLILVAGYSS